MKFRNNNETVHTRPLTEVQFTSLRNKQAQETDILTKLGQLKNITMTLQKLEHNMRTKNNSVC